MKAGEGKRAWAVFTVPVQPLDFAEERSGRLSDLPRLPRLVSWPTRSRLEHRPPASQAGAKPARGAVGKSKFICTALFEIRLSVLLVVGSLPSNLYLGMNCFLFPLT